VSRLQETAMENHALMEPVTDLQLTDHCRECGHAPDGDTLPVDKDCQLPLTDQSLAEYQVSQTDQTSS
jgi:hypothetical protein